MKLMIHVLFREKSESILVRCECRLRIKLQLRREVARLFRELFIMTEVKELTRNRGVL